MSKVRNGEQIEHKYLYSEIFNGDQKLHKHFSSSRIRGTSLMTCSFIGELRNGQEFKCENKPFIIFALILSKGLF